VHGGTLTGEIPLVAGAPSADLLLVPAGDSVWAVEGARTTPVTALDMTRELGDVTLDGTSATRLGDRAALDRALRIGRVLLAAEQVGLARRALELAVGYAGERRQFGRVIGSFQANKHRLADVWVGVQKATAVARHAVAAVDLGDEQEERIAASLASAVCGRMAEQAAGELLQIHGGLGFTWENPSHLYVKRARVDALALGSPAQHRHALAEALGLRPGQGEEHRVRT
jgi:alkylation response protein AidB-like acyl-CoA dehydrogenase